MRKNTLKEGALYLLKNSKHAWTLTDLDDGGSAHRMVSTLTEYGDCDFVDIPKKDQAIRYVKSAEILSPFSVKERRTMLCRIVELKQEQEDLREQYNVLRQKHYASRADIAERERLLTEIGLAISQGATLRSQKVSIERVEDLNERGADIEDRMKGINDEIFAINRRINDLVGSLYPWDGKYYCR